MLKRLLKSLLWRISPALFYRYVNSTVAQTFSIGILTAKDLLSLGDHPKPEQPVMTKDKVHDVPAGFVADPFLHKTDRGWYMFFETMNLIDYTGVIGVASSDDGQHWEYKNTVLKENYHLAYPYVFEHEQHHYMIPDAPTAGVFLYRAEKFPFGWQKVKPIFDEPGFSDSSIFFANDKWWLLTCQYIEQVEQEGEPQAILRLLSANKLVGKWTEHPMSPVASGSDIARPAGRVQVVGDRIYRFAQDCSVEYGKTVRGFEITKINSLVYSEREIDKSPFLAGDPASPWRAGGMHHIDAHQTGRDEWIACVDGWH